MLPVRIQFSDQSLLYSDHRSVNLFVLPVRVELTTTDLKGRPSSIELEQRESAGRELNPPCPKARRLQRPSTPCLVLRITFFSSYEKGHLVRVALV